MIDHLGITVAQDDLDAVVAFYVAALAPIGYKEVMRFGSAVGMGSNRPDFWITGQPTKPTTTSHFAFSGDRAQVDAFHAAAMKAGAKDNGAPHIRAMYHADYYGAFAIDPAGNNVEVVCHEAEQVST